MAVDIVKEHAQEVEAGERFQFGDNWRAFLSTLSEDRIRVAEASLTDMLKQKDLTGKRFLDVGSGSGIFSLAARRLGAQVHSFDYDPESVGCTLELKRRYFPQDGSWTVEEGSVLDRMHLDSLGRFDVVYSWGVLHHTGKMWDALENVRVPLAEGGQLFIAIYNDQGAISKFWKGIKRVYCSGSTGRMLVCSTIIPYFFLQTVAAGIVMHGNPAGYFVRYKNKRGMSAYHDWIDWLGGYPFEVATPEEILAFYEARGLTLEKLTTTSRLGCNQFVFRRPIA